MGWEKITERRVENKVQEKPSCSLEFSVRQMTPQSAWMQKKHGESEGHYSNSLEGFMLLSAATLTPSVP